MRRVIAVLVFAGALTGCASNQSESPWLVQREVSAPKNCEPLTGDQELVLGLSQELAGAGRRHAALANLERLPADLPQVRLSKARLLRLMGHGAEAEALYSSLLGSCLVADAHHGLGQIEVTRRDYPRAQEHLRAAASLAPANDAMRNDLGVVYMNQRRLPEARFELLTAMELNESSTRAATNMLTLLIYQGNWQTARDLVSAKGLTSDDFSKAEQRARAMRSADVADQPQPVVEEQKPARVVAPVPVPAQAVTSAAAPASAQTPVAAPAQGPVRAPAAAPAPARAVTPIPVSVAARAWAAEEAAPVGGAAKQIHDVQQAPSADVRPIVCRSSGASATRLAVMECLPE